MNNKVLLLTLTIIQTMHKKKQHKVNSNYYE